MKPGEYAVIRVAAGRNSVLRIAVLPRLRQKRRVERRSHPVLIEIGPKIDVPSNTVYVICSRSMVRNVEESEARTLQSEANAVRRL